MSPVREQILNSISIMPDSKLELLLPLIDHLAEDNFSIETNLTQEEKDIIKQGRAKYKKGDFVPLESLLAN